MRPGCSSSRMSRDNNSTQRNRNRAAAERLSTREPGERAPLPATDRDPERLHRTNQRRLSLCGSMGRSPLDSSRVGRDASRIADEVISHLSGLVGARVTVTLEIEAEVPSGAPDHVVRTVTENSWTLKFTNQGFEKE